MYVVSGSGQSCSSRHWSMPMTKIRTGASPAMASSRPRSHRSKNRWCAPVRSLYSASAISPNFRSG